MKNSKKKGHTFLILLLLLALTGILYIGSEKFQVNKVTLVGNEKIPEEEIIKRVGISQGQNILKVNRQLIKERIEAEPYLEVQSITFRYPDEILITLKEREAAAIVPYLNSYFIIDEKCYIMEIVDELSDIQYPLVRDVEVRNFVVGKRLVASEEYPVKVLSRVLESVKELELQNQISEIIMDNPDDIELIMTDGMRVRVGQAIDVDKKLLWLKSQDIKEVCKGLVGGILDLSTPSQPVFYSDES